MENAIKHQIPILSTIIVASVGSFSCGSESPRTGDSAGQTNAGPTPDAGPMPDAGDPKWADFEVVIDDETSSYAMMRRSSFDYFSEDPVGSQTDCVVIDGYSDDYPPPGPNPFGDVELMHGTRSVPFSGSFTELFDDWTVTLSSGAEFSATSATAATPELGDVSLTVIDGEAVVRNDGTVPVIPRLSYGDLLHGTTIECPEVPSGDTAALSIPFFDGRLIDFVFDVYTANREPLGFQTGGGSFGVLRRVKSLSLETEPTRWFHIETVARRDQFSDALAATMVLLGGDDLTDAPSFEPLTECVTDDFGPPIPTANPHDIGSATLWATMSTADTGIATFTYGEEVEGQYPSAEFATTEDEPLRFEAQGTFDTAGFVSRTLGPAERQFSPDRVDVTLEASRVVVDFNQDCGQRGCLWEFWFVVESSESRETFRCPAAAKQSVLNRAVLPGETLTVYVDFIRQEAINSFDDTQVTSSWRTRIPVLLD